MSATMTLPLTARRSTLRRGTLLGAAVLAMFYLAGDRGLTQGAGGGIDPLEVLKLQVRPNAIIVLDSSASMRADPTQGTTNTISQGDLSGDDPNSKMAIAKSVLKNIVLNNKDKISFQFGAYNPGNNIGPLVNGIGRFFYVTDDSTAASWTFSQTGIRRNAVNDTVTLNGKTYYYLQASQLWNGETVNAGTGASTAGTAGIVPPATLWPGVTINYKRPYVKVRNGASTVTFYFSGPRWGQGSGPCSGFRSLVPLADCLAGDTQVTSINPYLDPEVFYASNGDIVGYQDSPLQQPATTNGGIPVGVRAESFTPIAGSLSDIRQNFWAGGVNYWNQISTNQAVGQRQKTFVIFVTDGDDTCNGSSLDAGNPDTRAGAAAAQAELLYRPIVGGAGGVNSDGSLKAPPTTDPSSSVVTFFIAFGSGAGVQRSNWIAWGGSGLGSWSNNGSGVNWNLSSPATSSQATALQNARNACVTCEDAFPAADASALEAALQGALDRGAGAGEFSDQQSITESIFELSGASMDPKNRYLTFTPTLLQSTFQLPSYAGHLKAFANVSGAASQLWDAGAKLCQRIGWTGASASIPSVCAGADPLAGSTFDDLSNRGTATLATVAGSAARIKRRIFTTSRNGVNTGYVPQALINQTAAASFPPTGLWPPDPAVAPNSTSDPAGLFDAQLGIASMTFAQLQTTFGACLGTNLPARCTGTAAQKLAKAQREAREMILAYTAGAAVQTINGQPVRNGSNELLYQSRPWMMAESTLAAPGIVVPPAQAGPGLHKDEYVLYRDGPRTATKTAVNEVLSGLGLRNPDDDGQTASAASPSLKPSMTVVYHGSNGMLHAFRAGPCPSTVPSCGAETGGEELWGFVPYDQLGKLQLRMKPQGRTNHTYMIAAPVRFADIFVSGGWSNSVGGVTSTGAGVWRKIMYVSRGVAGKYVTALDVTVPGPFTVNSLTTQLPVVVWSRGNPDTNDGNCKSGTAGCLAASNSYNYTANDYDAYKKMGETWSVPSVGFVDPAANATVRKPYNGAATPPTGGVEFAIWMGSGFSSVSTEGKTFYALDAVTGDVIASHDIPDGISAAGIPNALVASTAAFAAVPLSFTATPLDNTILNPATELVTGVYFPDIHSRIWRFDPNAPSTPPVLFADEHLDGDQPIANPVALINLNTDATVEKPHVFAEAGNDQRVPLPQTTPFFRAYGLRDEGATSSQVFPPIDFPLGFRGTAQPAVAFSTGGQGRVFFVANKFNPPDITCVSTFDGILYALQAKTGGAAYDLGTPDERYMTMLGQRIQQVTIATNPLGGGEVIIDTNLNAQNAPAAPPPPVPIPGGSGGGSNDVFVGANINGVPSVAYKLGSSVCK